MATRHTPARVLDLSKHHNSTKTVVDKMNATMSGLSYSTGKLSSLVGYKQRIGIINYLTISPPSLNINTRAKASIFSRKLLFEYYIKCTLILFLSNNSNILHISERWNSLNNISTFNRITLPRFFFIVFLGKRKTQNQIFQNKS